MSTEAELLRALANNPEDTVTLGVLADLLAQRGDPRGEFIHLSNAPQTDETKAAIAKLVEQHDDAWMRPHLVAQGVWPRYTRGLVGGLAGTPALIAQHAAKIATKLPLLHQLALSIGSAAEADLAVLRDVPFLGRLRTLEISAVGRKVRNWDALGELPLVHTLVLDSVNVGPADAAAIVHAMPNIAKLTLSNCTLHEGSLDPFAAYAPNLELLDMPSAHAGGVLADLIVQCRNLRALRIPNNDLGKAGAAILPALAKVEDIDLKGNDLPAEACVELFSILGPVPALELGGNDFDDDALAALAAWPHLSRVTKIHLGSTNITSKGVIAFAKTKALTNLRSFVMSRMKFSEEAKAALIESPYLLDCVIYAGDRRLARPTSPASPTASPSGRPAKRTTGPKRTARPKAD